MTHFFPTFINKTSKYFSRNVGRIILVKMRQWWNLNNIF